MLSKAAAVNRTLMRNRKILEAVYDKGIRRISLIDSSLAGFDRRYFTAVDRPLLGAAVYHCYEFSYVLSRGRLCRLSKAT